jgi:large subunit ribosomal protein L15
MTLNLSNLKPAENSTKNRKRVGRGGKRGSYSGKGMKGQKARSGVSGLKALGFKQTMLRTPKLRGFRSAKPKMAVVNIDKLESKFADGEVINLRKLKSARFVDAGEKAVKILGAGKLSKKFVITANAYSESAKKAIEGAGGKAEIVVK